MTSKDLIERAYGTLFPVMNEIVPDTAILSFLDNGGKAVLLGEYGDEYVSGRMRPERVAKETPEAFADSLSSLRQRYGTLLFGCDADISAVNRLHHVAGELPSRAAAISAPADEFSAWIEGYARRARSLGVNMVLSPTADFVSAGNPWLQGRTLGDDLDTVSRLVSAFVSAARRGGVQTALKHFPGHDGISGNPARELATVALEPADLLRQAAPFKAGFEAGAEAVIMGSAVFTAIEPAASASLSSSLIRSLRSDFGFAGLVITLDLDHASAQGDKTIEETCICALNAGADLLLLSPAAVPKIPSITQAIANAVETGRLDHERLVAASAATLAASR